MRKRTALLLLTCAALLMLVSGCAASASIQEASPRPTEDQTNLSDRTVSTQKPQNKTRQDPQSAQEGPAQEEAAKDDLAPQPPVQKAPDQASAAQAPASQASSYHSSQPAPQSDPVDNSYFEDAAFIGDSRTDGFLLYSGIGCGENLTSNGLSIFKLAEKKVLTIDGTKYTLLEALSLKQYGKVYLSLGVNELGYRNDQGFYEAYCQAIDLIRQSQPNAVIYIQGLIPLNEDVIAETGGDSYLKNDHLLVYNDLMKKAAEEKQVVFLDLNPAFAGEDGQLPREASADGVHLRKAYCQQWLEYLKTHTVSYEDLYPSQSTP